jgi:hypothetical protein
MADDNEVDILHWHEDDHEVSECCTSLAVSLAFKFCGQVVNHLSGCIHFSAFGWDGSFSCGKEAQGVCQEEPQEEDREFSG